jgi:hypothetical protein
LIALDAAEAYIDVVRFLRLLALANQNVATHEELFSNVQSRFSGGRAGEGDFSRLSNASRLRRPRGKSSAGDSTTPAPSTGK